MRIVQVMPTLSYGDAIGNVALAVRRLLEENKYETEIYAERIDPRIPERTAKQSSELQVRPEDIVIYHLSMGDPLNDVFAGLSCRKILYYHNITPPDYFSGYNVRYQINCRDGLDAAARLAGTADFCIADSEFNKQDLIRMGYRQHIAVLPILIPFEDYEKEPSKEMLERLGDGKTNLLFVGRVAPNKKHEDIIRAFFYYKTYLNPNSRLVLAGSDRDMEAYRSELEQYAGGMGLSDVMFTGQLRFDEILACYRAADVFVCMSEHEGFCVPIVEAMYFGIPIVARAAAAVPETLGLGGLLTDEKSPKVTAEMIHELVQNEELREQIKQEQRRQLEKFEEAKTTAGFLNIIATFLGENK